MVDSWNNLSRHRIGELNQRERFEVRCVFRNAALLRTVVERQSKMNAKMGID